MRLARIRRCILSRSINLTGGQPFLLKIFMKLKFLSTIFLILGFLAIAASSVQGQYTVPPYLGKRSIEPAKCRVGDLYFNYTNRQFMYCYSTDTWRAVGQHVTVPSSFTPFYGFSVIRTMTPSTANWQGAVALFSNTVTPSVSSPFGALGVGVGVSVNQSDQSLGLVRGYAATLTVRSRVTNNVSSFYASPTLGGGHNHPIDYDGITYFPNLADAGTKVQNYYGLQIRMNQEAGTEVTGQAAAIFIKNPVWSGTRAATYAIYSRMNYVTELVGGLHLNGGSAYSNDDKVQFTVSGAASQTLDLAQFKNQAGTVLTAFDKDANLRVSFSTPASSSETCAQGTVKFDAEYIYFCYQTNGWKRVAWSTF